MTSRPESLAVVFEPGSQRTSVRVSGAIDMDDSAVLREDLTAALAASHGGLDIDLAAVTFCDSSGLHVLLDLHAQALETGKALVLTALSRPVTRLLHITDARRVLTVLDRSSASDAEGFRLRTRRYGPTVHLTPAGELDLATRSVLDEVPAALEGVDVVACDMRDLTFLDVAGLHGLLDFAHCLNARGIAFFAYNWRPQPRRLLDLTDDLYPHTDRGGRPTRLLRRLQDFATAARTAGAARARDDASRRTAVPPPP
ncbi:STAS domain-containing protein [Streptomyces yangpuensis]|uniref:STAS domain-containing protein n=1 Tax=Streptomyces yangpuensis TaxID=1648182 RepID=UPI0038205A1A